METNYIISEKGTLLSKGEIIKGTSSRGEWQRQQIVVKINERPSYCDTLALTAVAALVRATDAISLGQGVKVSYSVSSRLYNGRWYSDTHLHEITTDEEAELAAEVAAAPEVDKSLGEPKAPAEYNPEEHEDLPF